ncbi:MAG: YqjK-like family protein [Pantoea sp.]|nr:YqjK-like family protein [Pantoea sp.]
MHIASSYAQGARFRSSDAGGSAARRDWLLETARYDRGWMTLLSLRSYIAIGSSALAVWSVRNPNFLMRWAKRGFGIWSTWRLVKANLPQKH